MKFRCFVICAMGLCASCKNIVVDGNVQALTPVVLSEDELQRSYFSAEIIPHCIIELSHKYREDECYQGDGEAGDEYRVLHNRFIKNLDSLASKGGEYEKLSKDRYAIYGEAVCTLGFRRSCALEKILVENNSDITADTVLSIVTGEAYEYYEEADAIYPRIMTQGAMSNSTA